MAQSLFSPENVKGFHGEPYERAMGWFYRGLIFWMDSEPANARARFRTAQLMDALAEKHEYRADWVMLDYLGGFITAKLGKDGQVRNAPANTPAPPPCPIIIRRPIHCCVTNRVWSGEKVRRRCRRGAGV